MPTTRCYALKHEFAAGPWPERLVLSGQTLTEEYRSGRRISTPWADVAVSQPADGSPEWLLWTPAGGLPAGRCFHDSEVLLQEVVSHCAGRPTVGRVLDSTPGWQSLVPATERWPQAPRQGGLDQRARDLAAGVLLLVIAQAAGPVWVLGLIASLAFVAVRRRWGRTTTVSPTGLRLMDMGRRTLITWPEVLRIEAPTQYFGDRRTTWTVYTARRSYQLLAAPHGAVWEALAVAAADCRARHRFGTRALAVPAAALSSGGATAAARPQLARASGAEPPGELSQPSSAGAGGPRD